MVFFQLLYIHSRFSHSCLHSSKIKIILTQFYSKRILLSYIQCIGIVTFRNIRTLIYEKM